MIDLIHAFISIYRT